MGMDLKGDWRDVLDATIPALACKTSGKERILSFEVNDPGEIRSEWKSEALSVHRTARWWQQFNVLIYGRLTIYNIAVPWPYTCHNDAVAAKILWWVNDVSFILWQREPMFFGSDGEVIWVPLW
jgi:hypothetical protein